MRATDVCGRAAGLVGGGPMRQHGDARLGHAQVAGSVHLGHSITPHDVALMRLREPRAETSTPTIMSTLPVMPALRPSSPAMFDALSYREIWAVDFEFGAEPGGIPSRCASSRGN